jgi:hypothetical protein
MPETLVIIALASRWRRVGVAVQAVRLSSDQVAIGRGRIGWRLNRRLGGLGEGSDPS